MKHNHDRHILNALPLFQIIILIYELLYAYFFQSGAWPLGQAASPVVLPAEIRKIVQEVEYSYHFLKIVPFSRLNTRLFQPKWCPYIVQICFD